MQIPDHLTSVDMQMLLKRMVDTTTDRILRSYLSSAIRRLEMLDRGGTRRTIMTRD